MEIHKFDTIPSTNSALMDFSKKNAKSWTVFWTSNQTNGRGYSGNHWESNQDQNLAVSVLIKTELTYQELIYFNQWISNVVRKVISSYVPSAFVKWPNDIIAETKKVSGILVETYKHENQMNIVVGVGINVNQTHFGELSKAGSLASITGKNYDIEEILSDFLTEMQASFVQIEQKQWEYIQNTYLTHLFRKDVPSEFLKNQEIFSGIIRGVDSSGLLLVELSNRELKTFQHKEVELIY
ncbi:biotin--[acetyl-CoA-carboxylase] ligase [Moheibacter stercoris]|uniref:biotin--[biotin carboxyl-carrier protein] ligase n=1 Tax=Moheibacter stercoris TaxID=1628251 RepID=A0ABV2LU66_9FLAO